MFKSMQDLIANTQPMVRPSIGPRLRGLTLSDMVIRVTQERVLDLQEDIALLEEKDQCMGLEEHQLENLTDAKTYLAVLLEANPQIK